MWFDFDFQITTSKMIWILILNHLYLGDLILILKSFYMIFPISVLGLKKFIPKKVTRKLIFTVIVLLLFGVLYFSIY